MTAPIVPPDSEAPIRLAERAVQLHPDDTVAIAKVDLAPGTALAWWDAEDSSGVLCISQFVPAGPKLALRTITPGEPVRRYGHIIGLASQIIRPGTHVHDHNLEARRPDQVHAFPLDIRPAPTVRESERRSFSGFGRASGRVGTRNYVAVISTVNCSAHTCQAIAHHFSPERLAAFPQVDGVIALTGSSSCAMEVGGREHVYLQRVLAGMIRHPNVAAAVIVGLGCEANQPSALIANYALEETNPGPLRCLTIQQEGGVRKAVAAGIEAVEAMLPVADSATRSSQPLSKLTIALQCGGSDAWSGVSANPAVGLVSDELVRQGGTVILGETPEIYGAEHLLTQRAISPEVGQRLLDHIRWWEERTARMGSSMNNNPTPGNRAGGLSTIYEKALGAVAKGGSTPLMAVGDFAEPVRGSGLVLMNTPGYDPVAVTGQVAGGANLVLFTTGRGSVFGFKPAPVIKIASNSQLYTRMVDDMDFDAGVVLGGTPLEEAASELFELMVAIASGRPSKSEAQGIGEAEFSPWCLGETL
jgi:altronate hydrolase